MLRDYQQWGIDAIWQYFREHTGNPIVAMPTGTGKSHVLEGLIQSMMKAFPMTRVMMLTHVKELIGQNLDKFVKAWPNAPVGVFSAGLKRREHTYPITFAGIQSVGKKAHLFGHIDVIFIDECDLVSDNEKTLYRKFIEDLRKVNPNLKVVGLTATPWRAGLGLLTEEKGGIFTDIPVDMTGVDAFNWFIDEGYLVPLVTKPTQLLLDTKTLHIRGGEYVEKEMQDAWDKEEITRAALEEALEIAGDRRKWLIFGAGVQHCKNIAQMLSSMGRYCEAVYTGMENRDGIIKGFKDGAIPALVNNNILTTGFDDPEVDLILILRATTRSRLLVQILGRGTRPCYSPGFDLNTTEGRLLSIANSPKHNCMVLDYARNVEKLGPINDPVVPRPKGSGGAAVAPVKLCEVCNTYNHTTARFCGGKAKDDPKFNPDAGCGSEFSFAVKIKAEASSTQIIKKDDIPIVQLFKVDHVTYGPYIKNGAPKMMKVSYYCGIKVFTDYVCIEHPRDSFAAKKARDWMRERSYNRTIYNTVDEALDRAEYFKAPTHLDVQVNSKFPQIKRYCFDGTAFGANAITDPSKLRLPGIDVQGKAAEIQFRPEDDVPDITRSTGARANSADIPF